jgi:hypothetical protein
MPIILAISTIAGVLSMVSPICGVLPLAYLVPELVLRYLGNRNAARCTGSTKEAVAHRLVFHSV